MACISKKECTMASAKPIKSYMTIKAIKMDNAHIYIFYATVNRSKCNIMVDDGKQKCSYLSR